jgi:hypothetical protein
MSLTLVTLDNSHELIPKFIEENNILIGSYEDMMDVILKMIEQKFFFNMDKNILRGCMEDLTYMYSPSDDVNKDRVTSMLEPSDDEDEDDESEDMGDMGQMMEMMMKQMGGGGGGLEQMMGSLGAEPPVPRVETPDCDTNDSVDDPAQGSVDDSVEPVDDSVEPVDDPVQGSVDDAVEPVDDSVEPVSEN